MKTVEKIITYILVAVVLLAISYAATAGLVWLACWAFKWPWSWKISLGVWAIMWLISSAVKTTTSKK